MAITWDTKPKTQPATTTAASTDGAILWNDGYARPALDTTPAPEYKKVGLLTINPNVHTFGNPVTDIQKAGEDAYSAFTDPKNAGGGIVQKASAYGAAVIGGGLNVAAGLVPGGQAALEGIGNAFQSATDFLGSKIPVSPEFEKSTAGQVIRNVAETTSNIGMVADAALAPLGIKRVSNTTPASKSLGSPAEDIKRTEYITKQADQIYDIESGYAKLRDTNAYSKDGGEASRLRIAESNVLVDTVGKDGRIDPMKIDDAARTYQQQTIDGVEGVVRTELAKEKATVNINEIRAALEQAITESRLAPGDLGVALRSGIRNELMGLATKADEFGNILLEHVHDAKINTTSHIKFQTPAEKQTYMKAVARAYKEIVETKSKTPVREVNAELSKYYGDIDRIRNLGGRTVKGGRVGKYAAQIAGNVAGGLAGHALGPLGVIGGTVVGGEVTSAIKGRQMASTFGKDTGTRAPSSPILDAARERAKLPPVRDLGVPDKKVGAAKNVPKTKEIQLLERKISENVEAQKKAIKAQDFPLVERLKEVYAHLVSKLKAAIAELKKANKSRGFIRLGASSKEGGAPSRQQSKQSLQASKNPSTSPASTRAPASDNSSGRPIPTVTQKKSVGNNSAKGVPPSPTTPSKPSTATSISTGSAATERGGVSARKADTSVPFDGKLYHGTDANFESFDFSKAGAKGTLYGKGIYLSNSKDVAATHGKNIKEVSLDKASLLDTDKPIPPHQLDALKKTLGEDYANWDAIPDGEWLWKRLELTHKNPEAILQKAGINGVEYTPIVKGGANYKNTILYNDKPLSSPSLPKELEPLAKEARKYGSAEEFVKAQPKLYHGTLEKFDEFDFSRAGKNTEYANAKWGIFFSDDAARSKDFVEIARDPSDARPVNLMEARVDIKNPLDLTINGIITKKKQAPVIYEAMTGEKLPANEALQLLDESIDLGTVADFFDELYSNLDAKKLFEKAGYDGIIAEMGRDGTKVIKEYVAFNPSQVMTKKQLTDFYNKATGKK